MKRRTISGQVIEDERQPKDHFIHIRVSNEELAKIRLLMQNNGYHTVSSLLRDLLMERRIRLHREVVRVTDKVLRDKLNVAIYNLNKIGTNYNQVVSTYQRQVKQTGRNGEPYLDTLQTDRKMSSLMKLTQSLRDETAVIIDLLDKYSEQH